MMAMARTYVEPEISEEVARKERSGDRDAGSSDTLQSLTVELVERSQRLAGQSAHIVARLTGREAAEEPQPCSPEWPPVNQALRVACSNLNSVMRDLERLVHELEHQDIPKELPDRM